MARTITHEPLAGGPIDQIVALADGFALVAGVDHLVKSITIAGPPTIASDAGGGLAAAYSKDGSVYVASIPPTLDSVDPSGRRRRLLEHARRWHVHTRDRGVRVDPTPAPLTLSAPTMSPLPSKTSPRGASQAQHEKNKNRSRPE